MRLFTEQLIFMLPRSGDQSFTEMCLASTWGTWIKLGKVKKMPPSTSFFCLISIACHIIQIVQGNKLLFEPLYDFFYTIPFVPQYVMPMNPFPYQPCLRRLLKHGLAIRLVSRVHVLGETFRPFTTISLCPAHLSKLISNAPACLKNRCRSKPALNGRRCFSTSPTLNCRDDDTQSDTGEG